MYCKHVDVGTVLHRRREDEMRSIVTDGCYSIDLCVSNGAPHSSTPTAC